MKMNYRLSERTIMMEDLGFEWRNRSIPIKSEVDPSNSYGSGLGMLITRERIDLLGSNTRLAVHAVPYRRGLQGKKV